MLKCGQKDNINYTFGISKEQMMELKKSSDDVKEKLSSIRYCSNCGKKITSEMSFCPSCGTRN